MLVAAIFARWMIDSGPLSLSGGQVQVLLESAVDVSRAIMTGAFVICFTRYFGQLALRVPDSKLAQRVRRRGNGFVVCYAIVGALGVIEMWVSRGGPGPRLSPTTIGGFGIWKDLAIALTWLAVLAYAVGLMSATGQLRSALKKCIAEVSEHRATPGA